MAIYFNDRVVLTDKFENITLLTVGLFVNVSKHFTTTHLL